MNYKEWYKWWEDKASSYFTDKIWAFSRPDLINRLNIKKYQCILEIGFGYGREISQFCNLSDHVYGIELTKTACDNTAKYLTDNGVVSLPTLKEYNGLTIPFPSNSFNVIYNCFVIQHLSRDHAKKLICDSLRSLKHDGCILFEFFGDLEYYKDGNDVFSGVDGQGGMFNNAYTDNEILPLINECGGRVIWIEKQRITDNFENIWVCFGK